jgi:hypothetical protein
MELGTALFIIFCTPLGWVGLFAAGISLAMVVNAFTGD